MNPTSVRLTSSASAKQLDRIAKEYGSNRTALINAAVDLFVEQWAKTPEKDRAGLLVRKRGKS